MWSHVHMYIYMCNTLCVCAHYWILPFIPHAVMCIISVYVSIILLNEINCREPTGHIAVCAVLSRMQIQTHIYSCNCMYVYIICCVCVHYWTLQFIPHAILCLNLVYVSIILLNGISCKGCIGPLSVCITLSHIEDMLLTYPCPYGGDVGYFIREA